MFFHSGAIWKSLAKMCVTSRRLDVGKICLGNMGDSKGVAALSVAEYNDDEPVRAALLAIRLGMIVSFICSFIF